MTNENTLAASARHRAIARTTAEGGGQGGAHPAGSGEGPAALAPIGAPPQRRVALCAGESGDKAESEPLPPEVAARPAEEKSPAQWAYERLILYIQNFEKHLDERHEVALGFVSGGVGAMRIAGVGFFAPDLVTFYGVDESGSKMQLVQHVSQLNVTLKAAPVSGDAAARRIGFDLRRGLEEAGDEQSAATPIGGAP